jgi:hypothetical protein
VKVIDAYWEKRNLGLRVCEILFDQDEIIDNNKLSDLEESYDYLVAKIPGDSVSLVHDLENKGFRYLENQQVIYFLTSELLKIDKAWEARFKEVTCEKVTHLKVLAEICNQIMKGLYLTGRISADPDIKKGISDLRIVNWLKDIYEKENVSVYCLIKQNKIVGYYALERINIFHMNIVQAGIFLGYQDKGYSFLLLYYILKSSLGEGCRGIFAAISAGNTKTLNSISKFVHINVKKTLVIMRKKIV